MPLGLLRFTPTTIIHASIVESHKKIVSRVSSKKYQFPEIQSNAICVIEANENMAGVGRSHDSLRLSMLAQLSFALLDF